MVQIYKVEDVVVEISNVVLKGLNKYYDSLSILGYRPQSNVNKLLVLSFLEEMLTEEMRFLITEEDYKAIDKAINCLSGDCLIPYNVYQGTDLFGIVDTSSFTIPMLTEDNIVRTSEDNYIRFRP